MKRLIALAAVLAAACGQAAKEEEAPPAPQGLFEQAAALDEAQASVLAWQQLSAKADLDPPCPTVRSVEDKGVVPADAAPDSIYAAYVGARTFSVQCGPQLTQVRPRPQERWLVVMRPGAMSSEIVSCADEDAKDRCYGPIPIAAPAAAEGAAGEAAKAP